MNRQNVLNFTRTFNSVHNLTATAVQEYTHSETEYMDGSVYELSDPFFSEHIISNTFGQKDVGGWKSENGLASYMFRANYNYDSKYYIGASIRYDGLSKLPKDTRWGTFWGLPPLGACLARNSGQKHLSTNGSTTSACVPAMRQSVTLL